MNEKSDERGMILLFLFLFFCFFLVLSTWQNDDNNGTVM